METGAIQRERMQYDVVVVGAGPAGLACAIRLKQLKPALSVCVLEKAAAVGAQSLSGAVLEPGPLEQLLPEWSREYPGMKVPATEDDFRILTRHGSFKPVPDLAVRLLPRALTYSTPFNNHGNYIISLGQLTPWLAGKAEALGVEVFAGFAAAAPLYDDASASVKGVQIGDMGLDKSGNPGPNFAPGVEIHAKVTVLAEGCRGSISKQLIAKFDLARGHCPQTFALGFKELWQLPPGRVRPGRIEHGLGWPARQAHLRRQLPLSPRQRPRVCRVHRRARLPRPTPAAVRGLPAVQEPPERQGAARGRGDPLGRRAHHRSRRLAVDADSRDAWRHARRGCRRYAQLRQDQGRPSGDPLRDARRRSTSRRPAARRASMRAGAPRRAVASSSACATSSRRSSAAFGRDSSTPRGKRSPAACLRGHSGTPPTGRAWRSSTSITSPERHWVERTPAAARPRVVRVLRRQCARGEPAGAPQGGSTPASASSAARASIGNPCERFCPAGVYEMVDDGRGGRRLQINAANCVHCKACDIKDPYEIITWTTPEGGSGPNYQSL